MAQNMTVRDLQGALLSGRTDRVINDVLTEGWLTSGASDANAFKVLPQGTPNMTVRAGSGTAGDVYVVVSTAARGTYLVRNPDPYIGSGNSDIPIANGDASNPRIDGIDLKVWDNTEDSSGFNKSEIIVTQGTPASSPAAPAIPAGCVRLATVAVATGLSTSIASGNITDTRKVSQTKNSPFVIVANNTARDALLAREGLHAYTEDTNTLWFYSGTAWVPAGRTKYAKLRYGAGSIVINNTAFTAVPGLGSLTLPCSVDDLIEFCPNFALANEAVYTSFEARVTASGNYFGSGSTTPDTFGQMGWRCRPSEEGYVSGSAFYKATSADISGGNISVSLWYRTDAATNRSIHAGGSGTILLLSMINHGQTA